ncbi:undecaprenyl-diphosphate phosphatase [Candidatus Poriferisodalis sp.]|uniref:undecaprenyl-diphosphate phosphatase n=1 Tax=Candidatus Poriferisodalis sp. TaxID=3101277 RepID=UPI003B013E7C
MGDLAAAGDIAVAIMLGLLQGLTEFFPVSSSAHLELVPWLSGWDLFDGDSEMENSFDVALHVGTLAGAALYLRADIAHYAVALWRGIRGRPIPHTMVAVSLAVSAVPAALVGLALEDVVLDLAEEPLLIAALLAGFGWLLWWSDVSAARHKTQRDHSTYGLRDAAAMGLAQSMALLPGVSRSGVSITAGRWLGFDRAAAARLAFLMSLPVIAGAGLYRGVTLAQAAPSAAQVQLIVIGAAAAVVSSWLGVAAMVWLLNRAGRRTGRSVFAPFFGYRVALAAAVAVVALTGLR